jgi:Family of unknown function (DUF6763)
MSSPTPLVGNWYRRPDGQMLEVVAIDREDGTIEVQHFDGTVEEIEMDAWLDVEFEEADAPEDWSGSVDIEPEDFETERAATNATTWTDPLDYLDRSESSAYSEWPAPLDGRFE